MRMSCNGCRVLRKGCSEGCTIRPCLQWIKTPEAQANATVFLAKFYGRAGLLNLLAAGPDHLRPAVFRSLLYEACGRIVNPIYGSVGLLWSAPTPSTAPSLPEQPPPPSAAPRPPAAAARRTSRSPRRVGDHDDDHLLLHPALSHEAHEEESAGSHDHDDGDDDHVVEDADNNNMAIDDVPPRAGSEDTEVEAGSHVSQAEQSPVPVEEDEEEEVGLELTLGFQPLVRASRRRSSSAEARCDLSGLSAESSRMGLRLELPA
uniref:LOB domain-containing protein n=1 Tax=Oryza brachyantha TaxID=4533 RepID=J3L0E6_ORYBR